MNADTFRRLENMIRLGVIQSVDPQAKRCIVKLGDITTAPLRWITLRAGEDTTWDAPSTNEQCVVFSPSGELANGVVIAGLYSDANPSPSSDPNLKIRKFSDGAVISYNTQSHTLTAALPSGGSVTVTGDGGITLNGNTTINGNATINGDTTITGKLTVTQDIVTPADVKAGGVSLTTHKHSGVITGNSVSGVPAT